jgi:hypothetical protein
LKVSTPDSQQRLKDEAKAAGTRIGEMVKDDAPKDRMIRSVCIHAGMITETLIEYEEPDVVMEQVFARIADLLKCEPAAVIDEGDLVPLAWALDRDSEIGRRLSRLAGRKLAKGLDDAHEIAIALFINEAPEWEKQGFPKDATLRLLIEMVILSLTFEMATQDFCDMLIEDFITDGKSAADALFGLGAVAGTYFAEAKEHYVLPADAEARLTEVMARESRRHGTPGHRDWSALAAANDAPYGDISKYMEKIAPEVDEFFEFVGLNDPLAEAVATAKALGRMIAVITVEDVGQIHPSIAKSLAKTGMILGSKYKV